MEGTGGGARILLFSEVTLFEYNVSTISSPIVAACNYDWGRFWGRIKEKYFICWLISNKPCPTSIKGHLPWSQGRSLNRGSTVMLFLIFVIVTLQMEVIWNPEVAKGRPSLPRSLSTS